MTDADWLAGVAGKSRRMRRLLFCYDWAITLIYPYIYTRPGTLSDLGSVMRSSAVTRAFSFILRTGVSRQNSDTRLASTDTNSSIDSTDFLVKGQRFQYLVQMLTKDEAQLLQQVVPKYARHLEEYPSSLLARYLGLYRIQLHLLAAPVYIAVSIDISSQSTSALESLSKLSSSSPSDGAPPKREIKSSARIRRWERYHLKGSLAGRFVTPEEQDRDKNTCLKDMNFVNASRSIFLVATAADQFKAQLHADVAWLESLNLINYKMIVSFIIRSTLRTLRENLLSYANPVCAIINLNRNASSVGNRNTQEENRQS
jgi:Phosphatidylinositol-4-phosphate 5-Kinase